MMSERRVFGTMGGGGDGGRELVSGSGGREGELVRSSSTGFSHSAIRLNKDWRDSVMFEIEELEQVNGPKLFQVRARLETGTELTVVRKEEDFVKAGLTIDTIIDKISRRPSSSRLIKAKAAQTVRGFMENSSNSNPLLLLGFLDPTIQPPAYTLINADKKGMLNITSGPIIKLWISRYVVLAFGHLYIYKTETSDVPLAMIDVMCSTVDATKDSKGVFFVFYDNTKYLFDAASEEEMKDWVTVIRKSRDSNLKDARIASFVELQKEINRNGEGFVEAMAKFKEKQQTYETPLKGQQQQSLSSLPPNFNPFSSRASPFKRDEILRSFANQSDWQNGSKAVSPAISHSSKGIIAGDVRRSNHKNTFRQLRSSMLLTDSQSYPTKVQKPTPQVEDFMAIRNKIFQKRQEAEQQRKVKINNNKPSTTTSLPSPQVVVVDKNLTEPDTEEFISFDDEGNIRGATFNKLLERLCDYKKGSEQFTRNFLLTYSAFITSAELFEELVYRWEHPEKQEEEILLLRERICHVLCKWVELQFNQFLQVQQLTDHFIEFVNSNVRNKTMSVKLSLSIKNVIKQKLEQPVQPTTPAPESSVEPLLPNLYKSSALGWLDVEPTEIARQLTLIQMKLFRVISIDEFIGQKWTKPERGEAPNVLRSIQRFNQVSGWAAEQILQQKTPISRGIVLSRLIDISYECIKIRNFETVVQLISGLENSAISRLKKSWANVTEKYICKLEELRDIFSPQDNWKRYRTELASSELPLIPYLGLYLQSLTFSEDGNPDLLPPHNLINWKKYDLISSILSEIHKYQLEDYSFPTVNEIQEIFDLSDFVPVHDKKLYERSLEVEPRTVDLSNEQKAEDLKRQKEELNLIKEKYKQQKQIEKQREKGEKEREKKEKEKEEKKEESMEKKVLSILNTVSGGISSIRPQKQLQCSSCGRQAGSVEANFCQFCGHPVLSRSTKEAQDSEENIATTLSFTSNNNDGSNNNTTQEPIGMDNQKFNHLFEKWENRLVNNEDSDAPCSGGAEGGENAGERGGADATASTAVATVTFVPPPPPPPKVKLNKETKSKSSPSLDLGVAIAQAFKRKSEKEKDHQKEKSEIKKAAAAAVGGDKDGITRKSETKRTPSPAPASTQQHICFKPPPLTTTTIPIIPTTPTTATPVTPTTPTPTTPTSPTRTSSSKVNPLRQKFTISNI